MLIHKFLISFSTWHCATRSNCANYHLGILSVSLCAKKDWETFVHIWVIIFQSAGFATVFLAVHPVQPLRLDALLRLRKLGISSSDSPSDLAVPLFFLPLFNSVSQSPIQFAKFTLSSLSSTPICFQSVTHCSGLSACFPFVCLPLGVCLFASLHICSYFSLCLFRA